MRIFLSSCLLAGSAFASADALQDWGSFAGVRVRKNRSLIQFGDRGDITIARSDLAELLIEAQNTVFNGNITINGTITATQVVADNIEGNTIGFSSGQTVIDNNLIVQRLSNATIVALDPATTEACPGNLSLYTDSTFNFNRGINVCHRDMDEAGNEAFYYQVEHDVGSVDIDLTYHQYYSADAFASGGGKTVDSDYFCEGVTFAVINSLGERQHVYTAAVGYSRSANYTSYNCARRNCEYTDPAMCTGPSAPLWMGDAYSCNSGNTASSGASATWFGAMTAEFSGAVRMKKGDLLEVRVMADQASGNEDVGIANLMVLLEEDKAYPYSGADTQGWVEYQETTSESASFGIDPSVGGLCPGDFVLTSGHKGVPICYRAQSGAGAVSATHEVPFDAGTVEIDLVYNQYYSADAFASDAGADIDDTYFMEGVTFAAINDVEARTHLFSAAVGISFDTAYTSYNCPLVGCDYPDDSYCVGPAAHPWQGNNIYCSSKNSGAWEPKWYAPMGPADPVVLGATLAEGDLIEVRAMADQGSGNEDVGITSLQITVNASQTYPYTDANGWVIFEETEDSITVGIDPGISGACPGTLALDQGYEQMPICTRSLSAAGTVYAYYEAPFDVGTVEVDVSYSQYYSADAFASDSGATIDSTYFMEGVTIASVDSSSVRSHIFSGAVGLSYDYSYSSYNCPLYGCDYPDKAYCNGPLAHPWQGGNIYCNSKSSGTYAAEWYAPMGPSEPFVIGTQISEGDDLEVRVMADQASSNEDCGIVSLKMKMSKEQTYPYDDGTGWVYMEEPTASKTVVAIDPEVGGRCPGKLAIDNGHEGKPVCTRNMDSAGNVAATFDLPHDTTSITVNLTYAQHYSADGFASTDSSSSIDDSYFMEGIHISVLNTGSSRSHIFAAAVGIAYDTSNTGYNCPEDNCGYPDSTYCNGPDPPSFVGNAFYCDSGNSGSWESTWYSDMEAPVFQVDVDLAEGDTIEVRAMADQASSNEDVGIVSLVLTFEA